MTGGNLFGGESMSWERARNPEQKAARRDAILSAARTLFSELPYEEISLNGIAREAGFSKPNVYRYFSTREEIFLVIFEEEQGLFVDALLARLKRSGGKDPVKSICRAWVEVALSHRTWLDLLPQLSMSMEKNTSLDQLVEFKKIGYDRFARLLEAFHQAYPALDREDWLLVAKCGYSLMAGLWPISNPSENVVAAMEHPDVDQLIWDFEEVMRGGLESLIRGIEKKGKRS